jgi:ABC-type bacteriocin/lantibiotic exporter with double-glycine peptidase domain
MKNINAYACFYALFAILFIAGYRCAAWRIFGASAGNFDKNKTHYGGIATGFFTDGLQTNNETCGHAAMAFFLSSVGAVVTEADLIRQTGTDKMLSLADLDGIVRHFGFKTQMLRVKPSYFAGNPKASILHFSENHFVIFLENKNNEAVIFDPAYGQVYVRWNILKKIMSGYMLYVYN